jgi:hypothetical protein
MLITVALWTTKPFWPTGILNGFFTLLLFAISGEELIQAHARLDLDPVLLHGTPLQLDMPSIYYRVVT